MLITLKPHSSFSPYFAEIEYKVDINKYIDIVYYLHSMHTSFIEYLRIQKLNGGEESYAFVDKNLNIVNIDEMMLRRAKEGDIIYIVPAIVGGGGKRGGILAVLAIAAFVFLPVLGIGAGVGAGAGGAGGAAAAEAAGAAGTGGIFGTEAVGGFFKNLLANLALSVLSSLFSTKPKEEQTRQNDMFGSLTNSTASGVPVALNYGMVRVAGQLISGYINTTDHGRNVKVDVFGEIISTSDVNYNTPQDAQQAKVNDILKGFNQYG